MRRGIPLTDADRLPWSTRCDTASSRPTSAERTSSWPLVPETRVSASSRNKDAESVHYVLLVGSEEQIRQRLAERKGHFMNPRLLHSQFETLEAPKYAPSIDIAPPPETVANEIRKQLGIHECGHRLTAAENSALLRARLSSHGPRLYTAREF